MSTRHPTLAQSYGTTRTGSTTPTSKFTRKEKSYLSEVLLKKHFEGQVNSILRLILRVAKKKQMTDPSCSKRFDWKLIKSVLEHDAGAPNSGVMMQDDCNPLPLNAASLKTAQERIKAGCMFLARQPKK